MALFYVIADYFTWTRISADLEPLTWFTGTYSNLRANTGYWLLTRQISIEGIKETSTLYQSFGQISNLLNLPLLIFVATIILNIYMVIRITSEKH
jgi:hypothetical protein